MKISFGLIINCRNDELLCFENILSKGLESFHSEMVEELCLCLICVRIEFKDFFKPKRPKYYADRVLKIPASVTPEVRMYKCLTMDFMLEYNEYSQLQTEEGCLKMLAKEFMHCIETMTYPVVLRKTFDRKAFEQCVRDILTEHGLL